MPQHSCSRCGYSSAKWFGRCPECGSWGAAAERSSAEGLAIRSLGSARIEVDRFPTGLSELDRVLGGGLVPGSVVLLAGEPGIGKSTLVLQLLHEAIRSDRTSLLISGEESLAQLALRGGRLGVDVAGLQAATSSSLEAILDVAEAAKPNLLVVDSIQTIGRESLDGPAGSPTQVRDCAAALARMAKASGIIVVLVGHVTKDGAVAGPKTLEHMVDVVLTLDGERSGTLRLLRAAKNRFGPCDETGVFLMTGAGLQNVADPSAHLLADRLPGVTGSVVFPSLEGTRPVLVEIQALASATTSSQPRRLAIGLDARRLTLISGVLQQRIKLPLHSFDLFIATAGGISTRDPAADLAVALAIYSALKGLAIPQHLVAFGEVGLGGELRRVQGAERRLIECERLGFRSAVIPLKTKLPRTSLNIDNVADLRGAFIASSLFTAEDELPGAAGSVACYP
jgi:DNA repair protein RadA/Sms